MNYVAINLEDERRCIAWPLDRMPQRADRTRAGTRVRIRVRQIPVKV